MNKPVITEGHTDIEIGYLSGLFDGEGCIHIIKSFSKGKVSGYCLSLEIGMLSQDTVFLMYQRFGGSFNLNKRKDGQPYGRWSCNGSNAEKILRLIIPYLIEKKKQAELGIDYWECFSDHPGRNGRTDLEKEMQELYFLMMKQLKVQNKITSDEISEIDDEQ